MFALAGIPPTAGFFSKLYIFLAAIDANLVGLAVIGVVTSVVGAVYYLRIVKVMYFDDPAPAFPGRTPSLERGILALSAAFISPLGWLVLAPLGAAALVAARSLF